MSKRCARCEKTVYPAEELKCLDKSWHKGCFKCQVCNMTLNMKNYKGYDKLPYCNSHYPQTKHTIVADTPEQRRIAENTKIQSNLKYKSDHEKERFHHITKAEAINLKEKGLEGSSDPRLIKYHAEFEKMKGKKITITDDPEFRRVKHNTEIQSNLAYHDVRGQRQEQEARRPAEQVEAGRVRTNPGRISDYSPEDSAGGTPYSNRNSQAKQVYDSNIGRDPSRLLAYQAQRYYNRVERFSSSDDDAKYTRNSRSSYGESVSPRYSGSGYMDQPARKVGSISDYDPLNEQYGSIAAQQKYPSQPQQQPPQSYQPPPQQSYQPPPPTYNPPPQAQQPVDPYSGKGVVVKAIYDYTAGDTDEVSFSDQDIIVNCVTIDEGWMEGTVERTGQRGMLPSNYVEAIN